MAVAPTAASTASPSALLPSVTTPGADEAGSQERFLKLLVTQLKNQDPLAPMDNAQITSQIAQINTVSGIAALNTSVKSLSAQFVQMQALQGASLIGKDAVVAGNRLDVQSGVAQGGFELQAAADAVKVEVLSPAGRVLDTLNLGAQSSGVHAFEWDASKVDAGTALTFRVTAASGSTPLSATALMRDKVVAVSTAGDQLMLELQNAGNVAYGKVKAIN